MKFAALALVAVCGLFAANDATAQAQWQYCGPEGTKCAARGVLDLAYGAGYQWTYQMGVNVPGHFICRTATFGNDPAPGFAKECWMRPAYTPPPPPPPPPPAPVWYHCAYEGEICRIVRPATVRYGARGQYVYRFNQVGIACSSANFGDPIPGVRKTCEYSFD